MTSILSAIPLPVLYGVFIYMGLSSLRKVLKLIKNVGAFSIIDWKRHLGTIHLRTDQRGNQFFDRILLFFMPQKFQPDYIYLRHVKLLKGKPLTPTGSVGQLGLTKSKPNLTSVHLFTIIQLICFGILYAIKSLKTVSIAFPIMVVAIVGIRKIFDFTPKLFSQRELSWLDDIMPQEERKVSVKNFSLASKLSIFQENIHFFRKISIFSKNTFRKWMICA